MGLMFIGTAGADFNEAGNFFPPLPSGGRTQAARDPSADGQTAPASSRLPAGRAVNPGIKTT